MATGRLAVSVFLTLVLASSLFGQGTTLGSIVGTVFDASGSSVPITPGPWPHGTVSTSPARSRRKPTAARDHRLPRRACSRSIASNSALKLPLPKPREP